MLNRRKYNQTGPYKLRKWFLTKADLLIAMVDEFQSLWYSFYALITRLLSETWNNM